MFDSDRDISGWDLGISVIPSSLPLFSFLATKQTGKGLCDISGNLTTSNKNNYKLHMFIRCSRNIPQLKANTWDGNKKNKPISCERYLFSCQNFIPYDEENIT